MATVLVERRTPGIVVLTLNRPDSLNAMSDELVEELHAALDELADDETCRAIVLTGAGRGFCSGHDLAAFEGEWTIQQGMAVQEAFANLTVRVRSVPQPLIAAVNGPAAGAGACLALACDMRIATDSATLGFTFTRVGLHPDWGGSYFLPKIVGQAISTELIYTGGMINAARCEQLGLFNRLVPSAELESSVRALAGQIAAGPQSVIAAARYIARGRCTHELDEVLELEVSAQLDAFRSANFREGITAFLEKRAPRFNQVTS